MSSDDTQQARTAYERLTHAVDEVVRIASVRVYRAATTDEMYAVVDALTNLRRARNSLDIAKGLAVGPDEETEHGA